MKPFAKLYAAFPYPSFMESVKEEEFQASYHSFMEQHSAKDPMFALWSSYIEIVEVILLFLQAT